MEHLFTTVRERGPDSFPFRWCVPIRSRSDGAIVRGEADQNGIRAEMFSRQLADVEFTAMPHLSGTGVADMGVVRPHDDLRLAMEGLQVRGNGQQGIHHVPVAEIPGLDITAQHRAVVVFGIGNDCGILLGTEVGFCGMVTIEPEPCAFFTTQIGKSCHHLVFTAF